MGFRVTEWSLSGPVYARRPKPPIAYIALSDIPMEVGEDDVELTLDNGEWVKPEDSRTLEIERLGRDADRMIRDAKRLMNRPSEMAQILKYPYSSNLWHTLVERGFIQWTNAEPQSATPPTPSPEPPEAEQKNTLSIIVNEQGGAKESPAIAGDGATRRPWFYIGSGVLLCAILGLVLARK